MIYVCEFDGCLSDEEVVKMARRQKRSMKTSMNKAAWESVRQSVIAYQLLDFALQKEGWNCDVASLDIRPDAQGKPVSFAHPEIHFNISHCPEACACIVADVPVGIDVEWKFTYREPLMRRIASEKEQNVLKAWMADASPDETLKQQARFLQLLWSLKEGYSKWSGQGLRLDMRMIDFSDLLQKLGKYDTMEHPVKINADDMLQTVVYETTAYTLTAVGSTFSDQVGIYRESDLKYFVEENHCG